MKLSARCQMSRQNIRISNSQNFMNILFLPNMPTFLSTSKPKFYPAEVIILYTWLSKSVMRYVLFLACKCRFVLFCLVLIIRLPCCNPPLPPTSCRKCEHIFIVKDIRIYIYGSLVKNCKVYIQEWRSHAPTNSRRKKKCPWFCFVFH